MTAKKTAGHSAKHVSSSKHHVTSKHSPTAAKKPPAGTKARVTTKGTHAHHAKPRGFAVGDLLPVCAFEAVAQSLRLAGQRVSEDDVLGLWDAAGRREVSIAEALAAAVRFGLAGFRPVEAETQWSHLGHGRADLGGHSVHDLTGTVPSPFGHLLVGKLQGQVHGLILGVDVPGPHAVLAADRGWWSWGELYDPWPCRIEEAWAVSWS